MRQASSSTVGVSLGSHTPLRRISFRAMSRMSSAPHTPRCSIFAHLSEAKAVAGRCVAVSGLSGLTLRLDSATWSRRAERSVSTARDSISSLESRRRVAEQQCVSTRHKRMIGSRSCGFHTPTAYKVSERAAACTCVTVRWHAAGGDVPLSRGVSRWWRKETAGWPEQESISPQARLHAPAHLPCREGPPPPIAQRPRRSGLGGDVPLASARGKLRRTRK